MSPANHRHERVGEEIAHEINAMLAGELKDPRLEVSVVASEVRVQPDMKHARVFISVKGTNKEQTDAIKALEHASGFIRRELVERLQLRRVPELHFILDFRRARRAHRAAIEGNEEGQSTRGVGVFSR